MKQRPLEVAARLAALGVEVKSAELADEQLRVEETLARGGNRMMRRATAKAERRKR